MQPIRFQGPERSTTRMLQLLSQKQMFLYLAAGLAALSCVLLAVLVAGNVTAAGASICLDLSDWEGQRTREVMWGCEFPEACRSWFVYLPAYGFNWWLIGEVETAAEVETDRVKSPR